MNVFMIGCKICRLVSVAVWQIQSAQRDQTTNCFELSKHRGVVQRRVLIFPRFVDVRAICYQHSDGLGVSPLCDNVQRCFPSNALCVH